MKEKLKAKLEAGRKLRKSTKVILVVCAVLTLVRLIIDWNVPMFLQADALYDDGLLFGYAESLYRFDWLGAFGWGTLAKTVSYPLFICVAHLLKVPLATFTMLYYIAAVAFLVFSLRHFVKNKYFLAIMYILLIFCPITFGVGAFKVVYRNGVQIATTLMVIASAINVFFNRNNKKKLIFYTVLEALSLTYFYFIKEDGVWLMPFVIGMAIMTFVYLRGENKKAKIKRKLWKPALLLASPFALLGLTSVIYKSINYFAYGEYTITDRTGTNYSKVLNDIMSIKSTHTPHSWFTKEAYQKAVEASPTLSAYGDSLTSCMYEGWGMTDDGELQADLFYWRLRYCLAVEGLYDKGGKAVNEFYGQVHEELAGAFESGALDKETGVVHISSSLPNYNQEEFWGMIGQILPMTRAIYGYEIMGNDMALYKSTGSPEQIETMRKFTRSKIYDAENGEVERKTLEVTKFITRIYQACGLIVGVIGIIGNIIFFVVSILEFKKKKFEKMPQFLIELGLVLTYMIYFLAILWFGYKFTNNVGIVYGYMHPAHIILNVLTIVGVYNLIMFVYLPRKTTGKRRGK